MTRERIRSSESVRFTALLKEEGCPICRVTAHSDDRFFFWFFAEQYYTIHMLDLLTCSIGFCAAHAARLVATRTGGEYIVSAYEVVVSRLRRIIAGGQFTSADTCPPCHDLKEMSEREMFFFTLLLKEENDFATGYGRPGTLCLPHLRAASPRVPAPLLERLLRVEEAALLSAAAALEQSRGETGNPRSDSRALDPFLGLALGHWRDEWLFPSIHDATGEPGPRDPVTDLLETIRRPDVCCACLAMRRAWIEWGKWLYLGAGERSRVEDRLPACPTHAWALVNQGGFALAELIAEVAVQAALGSVQTALRFLRGPEKKPEHRWSVKDVVQKVRGPAQRLRSAREALAPEPFCPVCTRLGPAADRTLTLLFALLEVRCHRDPFQAGYGLCVRHFARALALGPPPQIRAVLVETVAAKLAVLHWELEEFSRKTGWDARPEAKQSEGRVPWKALLRFSGSLGRSAREETGPAQGPRSGRTPSPATRPAAAR